MKKERKWIFTSLFFVGLFMSIIFIVFQTNIFYKNYDFNTKIVFDSLEEGDSGSINLERNENTPSVFDWVEFDNGEKVKYFSDSIVKEKMFVDLPDYLESGKYYIDVKLVTVDGYEEEKTISFRVI